MLDGLIGACYVTVFVFDCTQLLCHLLLEFERVWAITTIIIIMSIYHALINALSARMIHINLNMIF